jgi:hypothetical protein
VESDLICIFGLHLFFAFGSRWGVLQSRRGHLKLEAGFSTAGLRTTCLYE